MSVDAHFVLKPLLFQASNTVHSTYCPDGPLNFLLVYRPVVRKRGRPPLNASRHNQAAAAGGPQEKRVKSESLSSKSSALLLKQQEAKSRIVSVEAALTFINRKNELSFTDSEQYVLEQLRRWAPLPDLIVVHDALEAKRNELTNAVVNTTISEATTSEPIIQHEAVVGVTLNSD